LRKVWFKRKKTFDGFKDIEDSVLPTLNTFDPNEWEIDDDLLKELRNPITCEESYYGFAWIHELERSPDYRGNFTFDVLKNTMNGSSPVEVKVKKVIKAQSKKGNVYYQVMAEDVTGQENRIYVWLDDWEWWSKEFGCVEVDGKMKFTAGNLLRIRLQPPSGGFNTFLLENNQIGKWRGKKRYLDKSDDPRVFPMRKGQKEEEKFLSDDEALELFANCTME
jgi:hypothetical protein